MKIINQIDGWLVVDKPYDMGSTQVVSKLKWLLKPSKIGHAGTLDPLATGLLPIALGKATRLIPFVMNGAKTYEFEVTWGAETDSDDLAGRVVETSEKRPNEDDVKSILPQFTGVIMQTPPIFSALKINGKRAYDLARAGQDIKMKPREITIDSLEIINHTPEKTMFRVRCSKGTYVRSLAHDMGRVLGCYGVVSVLRRTANGPFTSDMMISLAFLEKIGYNPDTLPLIPMETALDDILVLALDGDQVRRLIQGQRLSKDVLSQIPSEGTIFRVTYQNQLIALVKYEQEAVRPYRVFTNNINI